MPKILSNRNAIEHGLMLSLPALSIVLIILTLLAIPVHAATLAPECSATSGPLDCRLGNILHLLYLAAGLLGTVLVVSAIVATLIYRRNRSRRLVDNAPKNEALRP